MHKLFFVLILSFAFLTNVNAQKKDSVVVEHKSRIDLRASIVGKSEGEISKQELLEAKELKLINVSTMFYRIIFFKMTITCKGDNQTYVLENHGNEKLTQGMIDAISKAQTGCKIYFEKIKVAESSNFSNPVKTVSPISFVLN